MKNIILVPLQVMVVIMIAIAYNDLNTSLPVAVKIQKENKIITEIKNDLVRLEAPDNKIQELAEAVYTANQSTGVDHKLIISLMYTESNFNVKATGPPNRTNIRYKGLMQTPTATLFSNVDTLHGVMILKKKLEITDFDLRKALALYKGGNNPVAYRQADQVIKLYKKLKEFDV